MTSDWDLEELFGPRGQLARGMSGYEYREGQLCMATAVQQCLEGGQVLLCEAATGTGKTLAYLVPVIMSGQKVVISTATKALQEQILQHDLPRLRTQLGCHPDVVVAKGLGNYLCLRRLRQFQSSGVAQAVSHVLVAIERWAKETKTGDVAELSVVTETDPIWAAVCSSAETRLGAKCPYVRDCFVTRMRREAEEAQVVVANHHLTFADLALRRGSRERAGVLPTYQAIVFDEAHQVEDIASEFFGVRVSSTRVEALVRDAVVALDRWLVVSSAGLGEAVEAQRARHVAVGEAIRSAARQLFGELANEFAASSDAKQRLDADRWRGVGLAMYHQLDGALEALEAYIQGQKATDELQMIRQRAMEIREDLARVVDSKATEAVAWVERKHRSIALGCTPLEVGSLLRRWVFERVPACVMTSATMTSSSGFTFFRSRVGLAEQDWDVCEVQELRVDSPFDYASQSLLYTPKDLPEPSEASFLEEAAKRAAQLVELTKGGALVLCTSYRAMQVMEQALRALMQQMERGSGQGAAGQVLVQGQGPKTELVQQFRKSGRDVLVATMSFWQGVDIAGQALRLVIIDKLPFASPGDPIVMARCEALQQRGVNPFSQYQLPSAAITLKQGFGRLIRSRRDRGIVAVLDKRMVTRGYGKVLMKALPAATKTAQWHEVVEFWRKQSHYLSGDAAGVSVGEDGRVD